MFGSAQGLIAASDAAREAARLPPATREFLACAASRPSTRERAWLEDPRHSVVAFTDPGFPKLLRSARACPRALYVSGNPLSLSEPQLAVVGSRNPTAAGRDTAFEFSHYLAARGLAITSGLAQGIDSAAHRGAVAAQGVTVAVLGQGVDVVYPRGNRELREAITRMGAVASEFPLGAPPRREHFPQRNRIIAAMSLGTLVVEAACRSGSLITARFAESENRALFAVPGSIHNPLSRGCHELIRRGAKLTESPDDILSALNFSCCFEPCAPADPGLKPAAIPVPGMDKDHKILLDALGFDPADLDVLVVRTGFKPEAVSSMMLILELEGHVQAAPGGRYSRVVRSRR